MPEYYHPVHDALLRFLDDPARFATANAPLPDRTGPELMPLPGRDPLSYRSPWPRVTGGWASA